MKTTFRKISVLALLAAFASSIMMISIDCGKETSKKTTDSGNETEEKVHYDYLNISKDIKFVGDEQCYDCHSSIYNSYKKTEMGRSYYRPTMKNVIEDYAGKNIIYDTASKLYYKMTIEDGNFYQTEYLLGADGKKVNELKMKVEYVIGSGMHTRSYITSVNGYLSEMPVTWYVLNRKWDLSPGFKIYKLRFTRPILKECMSCHNSRSRLLENTDSKYEPPVPEGIGCESCHGPGELHVKHHNEIMKDSGYVADPKNFIDRTIVNPAHLTDDLKMDVCSQCHLQGEQSVFKTGKSPDDYFPGMLLNRVKTVYLKDSVKEGEFTIASHTARLVMSECFIKSGGRIVCMTCHDPHIPVEDVPTQIFNDKCLSCHDAAKLSQADRSTDHAPKSNCVKCHMLQGGVTDIPHVNFTDHWIRKKPAPLDANGTAMNNSQAGNIRLRDFYAYRGGNQAGNSGIAYVLLWEREKNNRELIQNAYNIIKDAMDDPEHNPEAGYYLGIASLDLGKWNEAEELLKNYVNRFPGDSKGRLGLAETYEKEGKFQGAINEYSAVNSTYPNNPAAFNYLGNACAESGNYGDAVEAYLKSIRLYPIEPAVYNNLGNLYYKIRNMDSSIVYYSLATHYNPMLTLAYFNLGNAYLGAGKNDDAEECFNRTLAIEPSNSSAYGNLSIIYQRKKDYEKAIFYIKKAIELNPGDQNAQKLLKSLEKQSGK